jgi:hypothetical protein
MDLNVLILINGKMLHTFERKKKVFMLGLGFLAHFLFKGMALIAD